MVSEVNQETAMTSTARFIGYARVSTDGQDLAYQLDRLRSAGCRRIFQEKRSGKSARDRPQLQSMLATLKPGDVVLSTVTDRMARDPLDMLQILQRVKDAGAGLRLLDEPFIDTTSEMADLLLFILGWFARWHRLRILDNTAHGREMAKKRGVRFGRPPKLNDLSKTAMRQQHSEGVTTADLAKAYRVSLRTVTRVVG